MKKVSIVVGFFLALFAFATMISYHGGGKSDLDEMFHFHPDDVVAFRWVTSGVNFEFTRGTPREPWSPAVDPYRIQTKLNVLSRIPVTRQERLDTVRVDFQIGFASGDVWKGVFDGETFVWVDGPLAGSGTKFDEKTLRWFTEGRYSFAASDWKWCEPLPRRISFVDEKREKFELSRERGFWKLKSKSGESSLDPVKVETWLERNCSDRIISSRDLKTFPFRENRVGSVPVLAIDYVDGTRNEFSVIGNFVVVGEDRAIEPQHFTRALIELIAISGRPGRVLLENSTIDR